MNAAYLKEGIHIYCLDPPRTKKFVDFCISKGGFNSDFSSGGDYCLCCLIDKHFHLVNPWGNGNPFIIHLGQFLFLFEEEEF